jgi:hypothetical protein
MFSSLIVLTTLLLVVEYFGVNNYVLNLICNISMVRIRSGVDMQYLARNYVITK